MQGGKSWLQSKQSLTIMHLFADKTWLSFCWMMKTTSYITKGWSALSDSENNESNHRQSLTIFGNLWQSLTIMAIKKFIFRSTFSTDDCHAVWWWQSDVFSKNTWTRHWIVSQWTAITGNHCHQLFPPCLK